MGGSAVFLRLLALGIAVALTSVGEAAGRDDLLTGFSLTSWHSGDGRPLGSVYTIAQDHEGYLWIGTDAGLFRFDGWSFAAWDALSDTSVPPSAVTALCVSRDGSLWAGFAEGKGVRHIRNGAVRFENTNEGGPPSATDLIEDREGTIWAVGDGALYRLRNHTWEHVVLPWNPGPVDALITTGVLQLYVSRNGDLWVGTRWGVFRRDSATDRFQIMSDRHIWGISEDEDGVVWTSDAVSGFRRLASPDPPKHALQGTGYRLLHDRQGDLWVATFGKGLWRARRAASPEAFVVEEAGLRTGLSSNSIHALIEDRDGNIWVGTTAGLHRLTPRELTPVEKVSDVLVLEPTPDASVWGGTPNGLVRFSVRSAPPQEDRIGLAGYDVRALYRDLDGTLWVGTTTGLWKLVGNRLSPVALPARRNMPVFSISSDGHGGLWLRDGARLFRWAGSKLVEFDGAPKTIEFSKIVFARPDSNHRLWIGFAGGRLGVIESDGVFRIVDEKKGFDQGIHESLYAWFEGEDGVIWIGGSGGLTRFADGRFATLGPTQGLPEDRIRSIAEDRSGHLWMSIDRGLLMVRLDEVAKALADRSYHMQYRLYDSLDGLAGPPLGLFGAARASDGTLWFIRGGGLTLVDPARLKDDRAVAPPIRIEAVLANDRWLNPASQTRLGSDTRRLQIHYTALTLAASPKVRFRYLLEGVDTTWVDAGTRRAAFYTNLPPRDYRFRVEGTAGDGGGDTVGTTWAFSIRPAYYQTGWFYVLLLGTVVLTAWWAWRFRLGLVKRQFSLALAERARLSRELHDTLLQSLVGVSLQLGAISDSLENVSSSTRDQLVRIRRHVENYVEEAHQSIMDLRSPSLEKRDLATALSDFGESAVMGLPIRFQATVIGTLPQLTPKAEAQLLRIGQEAMTNAIRHANASLLTLELVIDGPSVTLRVSDDGDGFDGEHARQASPKHFGLTAMRERAEEIGGQLRVDTATGRGTVVEVVVPSVRRASRAAS
jgi:ligand-binding sensor domain-containing protein/two-component sensor histidine kinase